MEALCQIGNIFLRGVIEKCVKRKSVVFVGNWLYDVTNISLSEEVISDLINQPDITTPDGLRDRTFMELLYSCGLRRTELSDLKVYDIDLKRAVLVVQSGKGNKNRVLPIGECALSWLEKYLDETPAARLNKCVASTG